MEEIKNISIKDIPLDRLDKLSDSFIKSDKFKDSVNSYDNIKDYLDEKKKEIIFIPEIESFKTVLLDKYFNEGDKDDFPSSDFIFFYLKSHSTLLDDFFNNINKMEKEEMEIEVTEVLPSRAYICRRLFSKEIDSLLLSNKYIKEQFYKGYNDFIEENPDFYLNIKNFMTEESPDYTGNNIKYRTELFRYLLEQAGIILNNTGNSKLESSLIEGLDLQNIIDETEMAYIKNTIIKKYFRVPTQEIELQKNSPLETKNLIKNKFIKGIKNQNMIEAKAYSSDEKEIITSENVYDFLKKNDIFNNFRVLELGSDES